MHISNCNIIHNSMSEVQNSSEIELKSHHKVSNLAHKKTKPVELYKYRSKIYNSFTTAVTIGIPGQVLRLNAIKLESLTKTQRAYLERSRVHRDIKPDRYANLQVVNVARIPSESLESNNI
jgi:hypothetical protein